MFSRIFSPKLIGKLLKGVVFTMKPADALRYLFAVDKELYALEGRASVRYGDGVHSKHRHIKYHEFFVGHLKEGQRVLDVGSGNGVMDRKIAESFGKISLVGIELDQAKVEWAEKNSSHPNVTFINADALTYDFGERFDVVILSNVLEHIEKRVEFLKGIREKCQPDYFLVRVPMYERDWRVPLQDELGLDYFLDPTHFIEYRLEELEKELDETGLGIEKMKTNWGEFWLKAVCRK